MFSDIFTEKLRSAKRVTVLTGAGVSAESGVPTFRGENGLWKNYRPEELATPEAFHQNPVLVWEWYDWRRSLIAPLSPNPAHGVIARMEKHFTDFTLITQNIDGLHHRAGNRNIIELHGNIWKVRCTKEETVTENNEVPLSHCPPVCSCGAMLRPHVVWFGEMLNMADLEAAKEAAQNSDLFITAGTSSVVQPAASFSLVAKSSGAYTIEINPDETPLSDYFDESIREKAAAAFIRIEELLGIGHER